MKKILLLISIFFILLVACGNSDVAQETYEVEEIKNVDVEEEPEESGKTETIVDLCIDVPEEDFKNMCIELYNDNFFKEKQPLGACVKVNLMGVAKYKYYPSDMQAILVREITQNYNLAMECIGCSVMHKSTKDDAIPSYFGEQIYVMFEEGAEINIDTFKTGEKFILYGIVIQNENGTYLMPKYYEVVEQ